MTRHSRTPTPLSLAALALLVAVVFGCAAPAGAAPRPRGEVEPAAATPAPPPTPTPLEPADPAGQRRSRPSRPAPFAPLGIAVDLYRDGDFASQANRDFCVPGALLSMMNMVDRAGVLPRPDQPTLNRLARRLSTDRLVGAGSEPEGWAGALNELGYGPYEVRSEPTRAGAVAAAAAAIRATGRPVGLLVWRGAHAWVMSGFEAVVDPSAPAGLDVSAVLVQDPWYPRISSIWGPGQAPNSRIPVEALAEDFLPWRRPTVRYPEKDGQFVLVVPVVERVDEVRGRPG